MEQPQRLYKPSEILYVDSNYSERQNCFGVVVTDNFWIEAVEREGKIPEERYSQALEMRNDYTLVRVLGTRVFRKGWECLNPDFLEPNEEDVFNYTSRANIYCEPFNLKPFIDSDDFPEYNRANSFVATCEIRGCNLLSRENLEYRYQALEDAEVVYSYLEGKRFQPEDDDYISKEDKLLRLLERAIPLN